MYFAPSASHTCAPLPRAMKRGVPPTARKARTGEFTPPGITRWARSNNSALVDTARAPDPGRVVGHRFLHAGFAAALLVLLAGRQRPEEAVGHDAAHAGPEAGV